MSLITARDIASQSAGVALYALTFTGHLLAAIARALIAFVVLWFAAPLVRRRRARL